MWCLECLNDKTSNNLKIDNKISLMFNLNFLLGGEICWHPERQGAEKGAAASEQPLELGRD